MKLLLLISVILLGACVEVKHRAEPGLGSACEADSECAEFAGICDVAGSQTCVQCTADRSEACAGTTPLCGEDLACRACVAHAECGSDACLPDGSCAAEAQVVYLKQGGAAGSTAACTKDVPCASLTAALAQAASGMRPYVRVSGTIESAGAILVGKTVVFLGEPNAALRGVQTARNEDEDLTILHLQDSSNVELHELALRDSKDRGVWVASGSKLVMRRSKVSGALGAGVYIASGVVQISESEIHDSGGSTLYGIDLDGGELVVDRSKISNNGGGVSVATGLKFSITNSFIVGGKSNGGVNAKKPGVGSKLEFNTIADNKATALFGTAAGGVICDDAMFAFGHNIIYRNTSGTTGFLQVTGACQFVSSLLSSSAQAELGSLGFVDTAATVRDYHLTESSPATVRDVAGASCVGMTDYDGNPRGIDGSCDLGADEYKP